MMNSLTNPRQFIAGCILGLIVGCGNTGLPLLATQQYSDALETALDTWKTGKNIRQSRMPTLRFTDEDYASGLQLVSYSILSSTKPPLFEVELTLRNKQGKIVSRRAMYLVQMQPLVSVVRGE